MIRRMAEMGMMVLVLNYSKTNIFVCFTKFQIGLSLSPILELYFLELNLKKNQ